MEPREAFYVSLGQRVRQLRTERGLTQQKLGALLSPPVTRASIANLEVGKQRVLAHTLVDLAKALGVGLSDLVPEASSEVGPAASARVSSELKRKLKLSDTRLEELARKLQLGEA